MQIQSIKIFAPVQNIKMSRDRIHKTKLQASKLKSFVFKGTIRQDKILSGEIVRNIFNFSGLN